MASAEKHLLDRLRTRPAHGAEQAPVHIEAGKTLHLVVRQHVGNAAGALDEVGLFQFPE